MTRLLVEAYAFAAKAHTPQKRLGPEQAPYVNHVCNVAEMVAQETDSQSAIIAAVLHDVVEDTPVVIEDVVARFGADVGEMVAWLTDDPAIEKLPLKERKSLQAAKLVDAPTPVKLVKIADQTSNLEDLGREFSAWPVERHAAYLAGARQVVDACRGASSALEARFDAAAAALAAKITA